MADIKSALITDQEGGPPDQDFIDPRILGGVMRQVSITVPVAAADNDADVVRLCRVRSNWSIKHIWIYNDAITAGTDYDVGLYTIDGGALVDVDAYENTVDLSSARTAVPYDAAFGTRNINLVNQQVWQDAGATTDPNIEYDLAMLANTIGSAAGDITVIVEYTDGS